MVRMTPSEAFVETLVANGVTDIFGIMGSAFMDGSNIYTAPAKIRLKSVDYSPRVADQPTSTRIKLRRGALQVKRNSNRVQRRL